MAVHVLDDYYLAITFLITLGWQLTGFAIAWALKFDKITDLMGGSNFFILALFTLLMGQSFHARNIVASVLVMVWAVRLGGFLFLRVLKRGKDARFDTIRSNFLQFLGFWLAQVIWVWVVSLPVIILNSPAVTSGIQPRFGLGADIAGMLLWTIGWVLESVADAQKYQYNASNHPKDRPMATGLWKYSRHPPYAGEIILWWGVWVLCLTPSRHGQLSSGAVAAQWSAAVSPLITMVILIFGSGLQTSEKPTGRKYYLLTHSQSADPKDQDAWHNYKTYFNTTSPVWPWSPRRYQKLPQFVKRVFFFEFARFRFDGETDGKRALEEEAAERA